MDLARIALFDVSLLCDDSASMCASAPPPPRACRRARALADGLLPLAAFAENGSRIDDMRLVLSKVSHAAGLFDDDGVEVRLPLARSQSCPSLPLHLELDTSYTLTDVDRCTDPMAQQQEGGQRHQERSAGDRTPRPDQV